MASQDLASYQLIPDHLKWAHGFLHTSEMEADNKKRREQHRGKLMDFLLENFEPDERGNYYWEFDQPIIVSDVPYLGLKAQRRVSEYTNENKVLELISKYNLEDRCIRQITIEEIDLDELYACNQEGIISDEEIESIIEIDESFALTKVKS